MSQRGPISTPYDEAVCPTPGGEPAGGGSSGGFDIGPGSAKAAPNSVSGLPNAVDTFDITGGVPSQVEMPPIASPGTFKPGK